MSTVSVVFNNQTVTVNPSEISIPGNGAFHELGIKAWDVNFLATKVFEEEKMYSGSNNAKLISFASLVVTVVVIVGLFPLVLAGGLGVFAHAAFYILPMYSTVYHYELSRDFDKLQERKKLLNDQIIDNLTFLTADNSELKDKIVGLIIKEDNLLNRLDGLENDIGIQFSYNSKLRRKSYVDLLEVINKSPQIIKRAIIT